MATASTRRTIRTNSALKAWYLKTLPGKRVYRDLSKGCLVGGEIAQRNPVKGCVVAGAQQDNPLGPSLLQDLVTIGSGET